jgi:tetratricopeptide (TPR) repeat protein
VAANGIWSAWLSSWDRWKAPLSYGTTILWGSQSGSPYDPAGGGFLNPLQAAAFFLGFLELTRRRQDPRAQAVLAALVLFLAPGFLSMGHEMCRVAQALPLILGISALGLVVFLGRFAPRHRWAILFLFLAAGAAWDAARVIRFLPRPPLADQRLPQDWEAFQVLKSSTDHWGPGLILCDFPADSDESLFVMSYPINAAENPRLNPDQASWAALLMDRDYFHFVSPRLAGSQWFWLDPARPGGKNWVLGWVPLTAGNRPLIQRWMQAHHFFWRLNQKIDDINTPATYAEAADFFSQGERLVQGDPFLESCFWERRGEFYYQYGYQEHYEDHLEALRQAIQRGYPAAHLYFKLGSLLLRKGDRAGALGAFRAALKADPHDEAARAGLNLALSPASKGPSNP